MRPAALLGAAALAAAAGCTNTDAAVFVDASLESPSATVSAGPLGTNLSGSFSIALHLGAHASGASRVGAASFTIEDAGATAAIVDPLEAAPADPSVTFPVTVEPDSDVTVALSFDSGDRPLPSAKLGELCGAGGLRITAVLTDSLQDTSTPAYSPVFEPSGCPE